MSFSKPTKRQVTPAAIAIVLVVVIVTAGVVYALLQLNVPSTPGVIGPNGARTMSVCNGSLINPGTPPFPSSGMMRYTCDTTHGAFTVDIVGKDTPTFTLPGNYTSLAILPKSAPTCLGPGLITITSGTALNFTVSTDYDLCASYTSTTGGTLPGFGVQWSN